MLDSMRTIESATRISGRDCIRFVARASEKPYIKFVNEDGCYSYVIYLYSLFSHYLKAFNKMGVKDWHARHWLLQ